MENENEQKVIDKGVEVDSDVSLMKVFNWINSDKTSQVFVYQDVQFWKADFEFVMSYEGELFYAGGEVLNFDEFKEMLLDQKPA